jgi:hypothetical protein
VKPDFDTLIDLISSTVAPDSWEEVGGSGSLREFVGNLSLVVSQTGDVHEEIVDLLAQLRRLQESKVMFRATNLRLTASLTKKLGIHGKVLAALTAKERQQILLAASRDAQARTYDDLKATLFNGQFMTMAINDKQSLIMQGVVAADKSIRVSAAVKEKKETSPTVGNHSAALLTNDQSLLVRMKSSSQDGDEELFRLITAEVIETP